MTILTGFTGWQKANRRFTSFLTAGRLDSARLPAGSMYRIPESLLPAEAGSFQVIQGDGDPEACIGITGLHEIYQDDHARLAQAAALREQRRQERETELRRNPPQPQDIVLNYWKIQPKRNTGSSQQGGVR